MAAAPTDNIVCSKCGQQMNSTKFYSYRDGSKMEICKKCLTMHVKVDAPETFEWIIEKADVPYVPALWNNVVTRWMSRKPNMRPDPTAIFGKYVSEMKLSQYKRFNYAQSAEACAKYNKNISEEAKALAEEKRIAFENGEISEAEYRTYAVDEPKLVIPEEVYEEKDARYEVSSKEEEKAETPAEANPFLEENFLSEDEIPDPADSLTHDDKIYLAVKWGRLYQPSEWVELEKNYHEMTTSFDIQDADTINTLKFLCKLNLKMNAALDAGDYDGFQKLSRVSDSMRKSAKFTAAQNKEDNNDFVGSVGELVSYCEREGGFIPRFVTEAPQDRIDFTLRDLESFTKDLVYNDLGLGAQIEQYLKKIQQAKEMEAEEEALAESGEEYSGLTDEDYIERFQQEELERLGDEILQRGDEELNIDES